MTEAPFIANTDRAWYDFLRGYADDRHVDEVNFWSPKATRPIARMVPRLPFFLRLKSPVNAIAGHGYFAHFDVLMLDKAWDLFEWRNGDPDYLRFLKRIGRYRGLDLLDPAVKRDPLGCTILRDVHFWPEAKWMPWGGPQRWQRNIVQGKAERDPARVAELLSRLALDPWAAEEFADEFSLVDADERAVVLSRATPRVGQGTFRARVLDAYGGRCAVTGEHTAVVLDAAHIQPYLGPQSNHVQNGIVLTKEFHTLFDTGYVGITPDHRVLVSDRLREEWHNGQRYYPYHGRPLLQVPKAAASRPSARALEWHLEHVFMGASA